MWLPGRRGSRFSVRSKSARSRIQTSSKRRPKLLCDHEILEESIESVIGVGGHLLCSNKEPWVAPFALRLGDDPEELAVLSQDRVGGMLEGAGAEEVVADEVAQW